MPEPWEVAQERERREDREREEQQHREEALHEKQQVEREEAAERRQVGREEQREREAREREAAQEGRNVTREQREAGERAAQEGAERARDSLHPQASSFTAGGAPSFLLQVPPPSFPGYTFNEEIGMTGAKVEGSTEVNLLGRRSVVPGSYWEVSGGYIVMDYLGFLESTTGEAVKEPWLPGANGFVFALATLTRGAALVWAQAASTEVRPFVFNKGNYELTQTRLVLGVEFTSPLVLLSGESLTLDLTIGTEAAWTKEEKAIGTTRSIGFAPGTGVKEGKLGLWLPGKLMGAFRYNVVDKDTR